mmetsp:Transcript_11971/g.17115  ORF Transcript_11971/g.17115 Transcript_11971/m.17115 type:complete len:135 (+) Transcript_11971:25-429(+)
MSREDFELFDTDRDGYVNAEEMAWILRASGFAPTEAEMQAIIDQTGGDKVDYNFVQRVSHNLNKIAPRAELIEAMKTFDQDDTGLIPESDMRNVLTAMGESLTADQAFELMEMAGVDKDNKINLNKFVDMLLSK